MPTTADLRLLDFLRCSARRLYNCLHPGRPSVSRDSFLSCRAKIEGVAKNILLGSGVRLREDCWINCMDMESSVQIDSGTVIMPYAKIVAGFGGKVTIGKNCSVHSFDVLYGFTGGLIIGDNVRIGVHALFIAANHNFDDLERGPNNQGFTSHGISVGNGAWIGAGAKILDGVKIGQNAVVGAGSVVVRDVPKDSVCAGVPCRVIRMRGQRTEKTNEADQQY